MILPVGSRRKCQLSRDSPIYWKSSIGDCIIEDAEESSPVANNANRLLLVSIHVTKKHIMSGQRQTVRVEVLGANSNKTILEALKMATKTSDPLNSPYRSLQSSMSEYFKQWAQNLTH
jgi:hypothetical protein